jgi:hypothetical protein
MSFDPLAILRVLDSHRVRYVVIGGIAAAAHGSPSVTVDLDICYARDRENLARLAEALKAMNARLRGAPEDVPFLLDAKTLEMGDHFTFATDYGSFDCLGTPAGIGSFDALASGAEWVDFDGLRVLIASLNDLIQMKRASGRPKDRVELEILGALRQEIEKSEGR